MFRIQDENDIPKVKIGRKTYDFSGLINQLISEEINLDDLDNQYDLNNNIRLVFRNIDIDYTKDKRITYIYALGYALIRYDKED